MPVCTPLVRHHLGRARAHVHVPSQAITRKRMPRADGAWPPGRVFRRILL